MLSVEQLARPLQQLLTTVARDEARRLGLIKRTRKVDGASLCQTLVFGYLAYPRATLSELVQTATICGLTISPQGLDYWLHGAVARRVADWLRALLEAALQETVTQEAHLVPLLDRFAAVVVEDSSILTLPGEYAALWPGCGGSPGASGAALKLAGRWNLTSGALSLLLRAGKAHDGTIADGREALPAGSLYLIDLGYFALKRLAAVAQGGAFYLCRYLVGTTLVVDGKRWAASAFLAAQASRTVECEVVLGIAEPLSCRLLAIRVSKAEAAARRRRMHAEARRNGGTPSKERLALADWTILITNVPPERLSLEDALVLARVRWQIELLWKVWKTDGGLRVSQSQKPEHRLCEVYAKLIALVVQHWTVLTAGFAILEQSLFKAARVVRAYALPLLEAVVTGHGLRTVVAKIHRAFPRTGSVGRHGSRPSTYDRLGACA
jgi:hypothetical protein